MRRVLTTLAAFSVLMLPAVAEAQSRRPGQNPSQQPGQQENADGSIVNEQRGTRRLAPLRQRNNAGPCPYVKILYDAARYVELTGAASAANIGYTGEIEGVNADCSYQGDEPITVDIGLLFNFGKGPQAQGDQRSYRYWIAVTERNRAILSKEYIDVAANFAGGDRVSVTDQRTIVIPRAEATTSGGNFEILVGFDVTPEMAEFNRSGSRFRVTAGQTPSPTETTLSAQ